MRYSPSPGDRDVPFPEGLRFAVADPMDTGAQFEQSPGAVEGWECGNSYYNFNFPAQRLAHQRGR